MVPRRSSKAVVIIVGLWVMACAGVIALATTSDRAAAQGCGGGGSPSASGSPSPSASESEGPIPVSLPPVPPAPDDQAQAEAPRLDPHKKVPVAQAQQQSCRSTITISYESGKNPKFTGKVGSDENTCKRARNVTVKKVKKGKDATVGKATTNARGAYVVPVRDEARGRFYSKVSQATAESDGEPITCERARSRTIRP